MCILHFPSRVNTHLSVHDSFDSIVVQSLRNNDVYGDSFVSVENQLWINEPNKVINLLRLSFNEIVELNIISLLSLDFIEDPFESIHFENVKRKC